MLCPLIKQQQTTHKLLYQWYSKSTPRVLQEYSKSTYSKSARTKKQKQHQIRQTVCLPLLKSQFCAHTTLAQSCSSFGNGRDARLVIKTPISSPHKSSRQLPFENLLLTNIFDNMFVNKMPTSSLERALHCLKRLKC